MFNEEFQLKDMHEYSSIEEIKSKFNIQEDNIDDIRKSLIALLAQNHPDKNGGIVNNIYYEISTAIEYIDIHRKSDSSNQLVPIITEMMSLMKSVLESSAIAQRNQDKEIITHRRIEDSMREYHSIFKAPAIAASTIFLILNVIFLFPTTVKEHPVLRNIINPDESSFVYLWLFCLMCTFSFWLIKLNQETSFKREMSFLKSEGGRFFLFNKFIYDLPHIKNCNYHDNYLFHGKKINTEGKIVFKKSDFISMLKKFLFHRKRLDLNLLFMMPFNMYQDVDYEIIENVADLTLAKALDKKIIFSIENDDLIDIYEVKEDYLKRDN